MNIKLGLAAVVMALGFATTSAHAVVIGPVFGVSGDVCEGGVPPATGAPCPSAFDLGDFNTAIDDPTLHLIGDTHIWGGVAHRDTAEDKYNDNFTLDLAAKTYAATFNWEVKNPFANPDFDGQIVINGVSYPFTTPPSGGTIFLGNIAGVVKVIIDPVFGIFPDTPNEVATWDLELTQVPLPASALLLIAGIGGLGAMRRFGRKAA